MKVLVSSKVLYDKLKQLNLEEDSVSSVSLVDKKLTICTHKNAVNVNVHTQFGEIGTVIVASHEIRWDFLYRDLKNLSERPIILNVDKNKLELIIQY